MPKQPMISIIANFYKSERYIPKLLKSVFKQTYTDWELICVNDCSPGKDSEVLHKVVKHYGYQDKVKIIDNPTNLGISKAKKVGIDAARGKYLTFIDGDDWFAPEALERMVTPAEKYDLDLVIMNHYRIIPTINRKWVMSAHLSEQDFNKPIYYPECFEKYFIIFFGINIFPLNAYWGKLFRKDLVANVNIVYPPKDIYYEDNVFNMAVFQDVRSMMFIDYTGYYWRWGGYTSGKKNAIFTTEKFISFLNDFFITRKKLIQKYDYEKALKWLIIELKNVYRGNLADCTKYKISDSRAQKGLELINHILQHPASDDIKLLPTFDSKYNQDAFVVALINHDVNNIYEICYNDYRRSWKKRWIKKLLHAILYPFS